MNAESATCLLHAALTGLIVFTRTSETFLFGMAVLMSLILLMSKRLDDSGMFTDTSYLVNYISIPLISLISISVMMLVGRVLDLFGEARRLRLAVNARKNQ